MKIKKGLCRALAAIFFLMSSSVFAVHNDDCTQYYTTGQGNATEYQIGDDESENYFLLNSQGSLNLGNNYLMSSCGFFDESSQSIIQPPFTIHNDTSNGDCVIVGGNKQKPVVIDFSKETLSPCTIPGPDAGNGQDLPVTMLNE